MIPFLGVTTAGLQWILYLVIVILVYDLTPNFKALAKFYSNKDNYSDPALYETTMSARTEAIAEYSP